MPISIAVGRRQCCPPSLQHAGHPPLATPPPSRYHPCPVPPPHRDVQENIGNHGGDSPVVGGIVAALDVPPLPPPPRVAAMVATPEAVGAAVPSLKFDTKRLRASSRWGSKSLEEARPARFTEENRIMRDIWRKYEGVISVLLKVNGI